MFTNAISDNQNDSSGGAKSSDAASQMFAQNVFRTNPSDFLNAIQDMTSKSGSTGFLQPIMLFGGNDTSSTSDKSGSSESGSLPFNPIDLTSPISLASDIQKMMPSLGSPADNQSLTLPIAFPSESNSGLISNLPESNSSQNAGSSETSLPGQTSVPSESIAGQTAVSPETSSSGLDSNVGQTAVSPESSTPQQTATEVTGQTQTGGESSSLQPNSSMDQMPQISGSSNNNEITQFETEIMNNIEQLVQLLENKYKPEPQPNPEPIPEPKPGPDPCPPFHALQGDIAGMTTPNSTSPTIQFQTTDGQTKTAPLPPSYDGTGSYSLYSDGVLAYSPSDKNNGQYYLNDSANPPSWIEYNGTAGQDKPEGNIVQSWPLEQPGPSPAPTTPGLQGDVGGFIPPNPNDTTLSYNTQDGTAKKAALPSDYNGSGTFSLYSDGVIAYSGPAGSVGGECYLDDSKNPAQWVNYDGPTAQRPSGEVVDSFQVGSDVTGIVSPDKNATSMLVKSNDNGWQSVTMPSNYDGTGGFSLYSNGVLTYCPSNSIDGSGVMYLSDSQNPPVWVSNVAQTALSPNDQAVMTWTPGQPNGLTPVD